MSVVIIVCSDILLNNHDISFMWDLSPLDYFNIHEIYSATR